MALEALDGVKEIGGFKVFHTKGVSGPCEIRVKDYPIFVNERDNSIEFTIQNGPIKEVGVNGCQVDTLVHVAKEIIGKLNEKFPCKENTEALSALGEAIFWLNERTKNREKRGVEGTNEV